MFASRPALIPSLSRPSQPNAGIVCCPILDPEPTRTWTPPWQHVSTIVLAKRPSRGKRTKYNAKRCRSRSSPVERRFGKLIPRRVNGRFSGPLEQVLVTLKRSAKNGRLRDGAQRLTGSPRAKDRSPRRVGSGWVAVVIVGIQFRTMSLPRRPRMARKRQVMGDLAPSDENSQKVGTTSPAAAVLR